MLCDPSAPAARQHSTVLRWWQSPECLHDFNRVEANLLQLRGDRLALTTSSSMVLAEVLIPSAMDLTSVWICPTNS